MTKLISTFNRILGVQQSISSSLVPLLPPPCATGHLSLSFLLPVRLQLPWLAPKRSHLNLTTMDGLHGTAACFSPGKAMSPQVISLGHRT
jgi:hypothetical protein